MHLLETIGNTPLIELRNTTALRKDDFCLNMSVVIREEA